MIDGIVSQRMLDYALENHDRVVSVPTLTYSNDFYDMMGVRHPDMFKPLHHETGHFLDPFLNNQYPEEYKLYLTPDVEMFKSNLNKEHDSKISENYADLMELRAKIMKQMCLTHQIQMLFLI